LKVALYGTGHGAPTAMAKRLGVTASNWANAKAGLGLSVKLITKIVQNVPGMTSDWLLFGDRRALTYEMAERLGLIPPETG
jgi:hypothetical protein